MNVQFRLLIAAIVVSGSNSSIGQGTFQNLDFESAGGLVHDTSVAAALPSWSAYVGGRTFPIAFYNDIPLDGSYVGVFDTDAPSYMPRPLFGNFSAYIAAGYGGDVSLAQSGFIDPTLKTVTFATDPNTNPFNDTFSFSVNGQVVGLQLLSTSSRFRVWAADVSGVAGTVAEIRFSLKSFYAPGHIGAYEAYLDRILFSTNPIPEPTSIVLVLCGLGMLTTFLRSQKRS